MLDHEYSLLGGFNRVRIGQILAIGSSALSSLLILSVLSFIDVVNKMGISANIPPALFSLIGAGSLFTLLYWFFNRHIWRLAVLSRILNVPDLRGEWICRGKTLNADGTVTYTWDGMVTITQCWDKLRIQLKTASSTSNSICAALLFDEMNGYRILYNYQNMPKVGEAALLPHIGFTDLMIDKQVQTGEANYFTGRGRILSR